MVNLDFWSILAFTIISFNLNDAKESMNDPKLIFKEKLAEYNMTVEDEMNNRENILTQLLGDYDKVKTLSEGSDCGCKCVVRPLSRSACRRIEEGSAKAQDFYTVETVTSGSDCKCACIAPPSALNPCEGEFRLKKLQEAGKDDIKLSTIMELLEGAFYGMDLLKLHSVTTKLLHRVENIEKAVSEQNTEERLRFNGGYHSPVQGKDRETHKHAANKKKTASQTVLQGDGDVTASRSHKENKHEERQLVNQGLSRPLLKRSQPDLQAGSRHKLEEQRVAPQHKASSQDVVIRGVTYYKSDLEENDDLEEHLVVDEVLSGDGSVDLLIDDQAPKKRRTAYRGNGRVRKAGGGVAGDEAVGGAWVEQPALVSDMGTADHRSPPTAVIPATKSVAADPPMATINPITTTATTTAAALTQAILNKTITMADATVPLPANVSGQEVLGKPKYSISWTESPEDQRLGEESQKNSGVCKDTLATISDPVTHNTFGRSEGAWMRDPKDSDDKIYVTNYYYGNILQEFRNMEVFKEGNPTNSYKLPYNWMGTGHVVYNKALYYNRAFSRDIIKFDLSLRYVAAWTVLHDAVFEEDTPWRWKGHSDIDFAVDESGLWVIYPALDDEGFHQEVIMLNKLNPVDLSMHKETSWRTSLRRNFYGNCFVICGVLYAIDSYDQMNANISYAFDTHTNTQMIPQLPFTNNYTYNTQVDYNPKERALYSWDNGHQVTYKVIFAY